MRILDEDNDKKLDRVSLYLTIEEAQELFDDLESLLKKPKANHAHISNENFDKEITISIYDEDDLSGYEFNDRSIKLIKNDE